MADDTAAALIAGGAWGAETETTDLPGLPGTTRPSHRPELATLGQSHALVSASYDGELAEDDLRGRAALALRDLGLVVPRVVIGRRDDASWAERWKEFWKPMRFGRRLWVVPSWEKHTMLASDALVLHLDPGLAFGTGQHATTALCLEVLDASLPAALAKGPMRLLDVGSGSGVLAIAAAKLGARRIVAIDNDPLAVRVTGQNVAQNGFSAAVSVSGADLADLEATFDWVVANVITHTLLEMCDALLARLAPGGTLVLSGILATQADEITGAFVPHARARGHEHFELSERRERDGWVALRFSAGGA
jgi:ribosomal protein L11 methyltransferase